MSIFGWIVVVVLIVIALILFLSWRDAADERDALADTVQDMADLFRRM